MVFRNIDRNKIVRDYIKKKKIKNKRMTIRIINIDILGITTKSKLQLKQNLKKNRDSISRFLKDINTELILNGNIFYIKFFK